MSQRLLLPILCLAAACAAEDPSGVGLLVTERVEFPWDAAYDGVGDGRVALLPLDVMVYDALTGDPLSGVEVVLDGDVVAFLPGDAVFLAGRDCDGCVWDAYRDEFVEVDAAYPTWVDVTVGTAPLVAMTDADGLVRVYAEVDSLAGTSHGGGALHGLEADADLSVTVGGAVRTVRLSPR